MWHDGKHVVGLLIGIFILYLSKLFLPLVVRAQDPQQYVNVGGTLRTFVVHLPIGYNSKSKYPLVILLHGAGQTAEDMARLSRFDFTADRYGIIAFYPNAEDVRWDIGVPTTRPKRQTSRRGGFGSPMPLPLPGGGGRQRRGAPNNSP